MFFLGCSSAKLGKAWEKTKHASYSAATDYGTLIPLAVKMTLLTTNSDKHLTRYIMEHNKINSKNDEIYRDINGIETYVTALLIEDKKSETKLQRILVETAGFTVAKHTTNALNSEVTKENPALTGNNAIGSHHAIEPFTGSAMNRRNISEINMPDWGKYTLNGMSYLSATGSALIRVQEGGHFLGDQFLHASIGNFIGIFFYDAFMQENTNLQISLQNDSAYAYVQWKF